MAQLFYLYDRTSRSNVAHGPYRSKKEAESALRRSIGKNRQKHFGVCLFTDYEIKRMGWRVEPLAPAPDPLAEIRQQYLRTQIDGADGSDVESFLEWLGEHLGVTDAEVEKFQNAIYEEGK